MTIGSSLLLFSFAAVDTPPKIEFLPPVRLEAGGEIVDTEIGHAAPWHGDIDGDGTKDLLVGQFGGGILWVYRNEGTDSARRYARRTKFQAGGADGTVPTG